MKLTDVTALQAARFLLASLIVATFAPVLDAAVLVTNVDEPRRDASTIQADPNDVVPLPWATQSFTTDGQTYHLDSIDAVLGNLLGAPDIVAELRADTDGSSPGTLITTLSTSGTISGGLPASVAFLPSVTTELAASTTYWLVFGALGAGSYAWEYAEGNGFSGPGSIGNYNYSSDQGVAWTFLGSDNPFKIAVNASPVPVPGVALLFGAALGGLLGLRGRGGDGARPATLSDDASDSFLRNV